MTATIQCDTETKSGYLTPAEFASNRRLSIRTIYNYLAAGRIQGAQQAYPGAAYRIPRDAVISQ